MRVLAVIVVLALPASARAARSHDLTVRTDAFTAPTHVRVTLPVGYDDAPKRRWPVVYYLHGTNHDERTFTEEYDGERLTRTFPAIVVAPRGDSGYWSDWFNAGAFGPPRYETFVVRDLVPLIDQRFRTTASRGGRALMGESMGGYGAISLAARHPDRFAAAVSISGVVDSNDEEVGALISASPTLQGGKTDAIYGPRSRQAIRWHGANPVDLADNLAEVDLQLRSASGDVSPADAKGDPLYGGDCPFEKIAHRATVTLHQRLDSLGIAHEFQSYGKRCHSPRTFKDEIDDALPLLVRRFHDPQPAPKRFDYKAIAPHFGVWGWRVSADPRRALEFLRLRGAGRSGVAVEGTGTTTITTPRLFRKPVRVEGGELIWQRKGRVRFTVDLGPPNTVQADTPDAGAAVTGRSVRFRRR
jgi:S-formylglutathione hydrolase FrmB